MARTAIVLNTPKFTAATTEAGLTTGDAFECQITSAEINAVPKSTTIPATGCAPETQSPGLTGWELALAWLQDWGADPSMSQFAFDNDAKLIWYQLELTTGLKAVGQAYAVAGSFGGTFGDGSAADTEATWPCLAKPTITEPVALAATAADE